MEKNANFSGYGLQLVNGKYVWGKTTLVQAADVKLESSEVIKAFTAFNEALIRNAGRKTPFTNSDSSISYKYAPAVQIVNATTTYGGQIGETSLLNICTEYAKKMSPKVVVVADAETLKVEELVTLRNAISKIFNPILPLLKTEIQPNKTVEISPERKALCESVVELIAKINTVAPELKGTVDDLLTFETNNDIMQLAILLAGKVDKINNAGDELKRKQAAAKKPTTSKHYVAFEVQNLLCTGEKVTLVAEVVKGFEGVHVVAGTVGKNRTTPKIEFFNTENNYGLKNISVYHESKFISLHNEFALSDVPDFFSCELQYLPISEAIAKSKDVVNVEEIEEKLSLSEQTVKALQIEVTTLTDAHKTEIQKMKTEMADLKKQLKAATKQA